MSPNTNKNSADKCSPSKSIQSRGAPSSLREIFRLTEPRDRQSPGEGVEHSGGPRREHITTRRAPACKRPSTIH
eukprot:9478053-Pyramimonas_sp.AAC.1